LFPSIPSLARGARSIVCEPSARTAPFIEGLLAGVLQTFSTFIDASEIIQHDGLRIFGVDADVIPAADPGQPVVPDEEFRKA